MLRLLLILALALVSPAAAHATQVGDWMVVQSLPVGVDLRIVDASGAVVEGRFQRATADTVTVETAGRSVEVPRSQIAQVARRGKGRNVGKGAKYGALVGATLGATVAAVGARTNRLYWVPFLAGAWAGFGAVAGAIAGALIHPTRDRYSVVFAASSSPAP